MNKIDGITDIRTDVANNRCSFRLEEEETDYQSQLAVFAETNPHLVDYSIQ